MSEMDPDVVQGNVTPELALETPEADAVEQAQLVASDEDEEEEYREE
jgi:hypothetical protein